MYSDHVAAPETHFHFRKAQRISASRARETIVCVCMCDMGDVWEHFNAKRFTLYMCGLHSLRGGLMVLLLGINGIARVAFFDCVKPGMMDN